MPSAAETPARLLVLSASMNARHHAALAETLSDMRAAGLHADLVLAATAALDDGLARQVGAIFRLPEEPCPPRVPPAPPLAALAGLTITEPMLWRRPGEDGGFSVLLPPGTRWARLELRLDGARQISVWAADGPAAPSRIATADLAPGRRALEVEIPEATAAFTLLECRLEGGLRLLGLDCGDGRAVQRMSMALSGAAWLRLFRAGNWQASIRALRPPPRGMPPASPTLAAWLHRNLRHYDSVLMAFEAGPGSESMARCLLEATGVPRLLLLLLEGEEHEGVPGAALQQLRADAAAAICLRPDLWELPTAPAAVLSAARRLAGQAAPDPGAALGVERPFLLVASQEGTLPRGLEALLRPLTAAAGLDLVLAEAGLARRVSPWGGSTDARVPVASLLRGQDPRCIGLWLPEPLADERALIALGWEAGIPVLTHPLNPHARGLGAAAIDSMERIGDLLCDGAQRDGLAEDGRRRLAALERARSNWFRPVGEARA
ncbi:hypothetical protein EOD42_23490 [Rhodovarius crocodyli]|uniref:Uncharacterized protein n=1 Tax=Rhodovarius crocodyli TaxID=1979269 RepID=A0A437LYU7_9PROT|nr:hypothetical protein [Rhodovarius crocodyli]RVT90599.1 hypothetical protein EOD42_23490 [Rhodovarius crocodyli]